MPRSSRYFVVDFRFADAPPCFLLFADRAEALRVLDQLRFGGSSTTVGGLYSYQRLQSALDHGK